jgi:GT2 family glycosyltransferase
MSPATTSRAIPRLEAGLRAAAARATRPAELVWTLRQAWRRTRAEPRYRLGLAAGEYLVVPPATPRPVLISVVMPVHRVAEAHLRQAIDSVRGQSHDGWELVIVADGPPEASVDRVIAAAALDERRIRVLRRRETGGIAAASDEGIAAARGDFVAFLDHDDVLHPRALELVARRLAVTPDADWLFTDEDTIDEAGVHGRPCFKPGWSRHLLLSFNLVAHLRVVRRATLERVGRHRRGFDGAQDYDLALRVLAAGGRFVHVPGVLYHWRSVATSMARGGAAKPEALSRAARALRDHLEGIAPGSSPDVRVLVASAALFASRVVPGGAAPVYELPDDAGFDARRLIEQVRGADAGALVLRDSGGLGVSGRAELAALLAVPGTAVAAARRRRRHRVSSSGWLVGTGGRLLDPWEGLPIADPGYLNLALMPGRRLAPPDGGWMARADTLLAAWEAAPDAAPAWRLWQGLERLGLEVVTSPVATLEARTAHSCPSSPPAAPAMWQTAWLEGLGLADWRPGEER